MNPQSLRVLEYLAAHPHPSIREIKDDLSISTTSVVNFYLDDLLGRGLIERPKIPGTDRYIARQFSVTDEGWRILGRKPVCPHCGRLLLMPASEDRQNPEVVHRLEI